MVEYALLAALISVVVIVSLRSLGEKIDNVFCVKVAAEIGDAGVAGGEKINPCTGQVITDLDYND